MGLVALQVTGSEKQGLGFCLIVDGKIWPAKINDPGTQNFPRNKLDANHSFTEDFKQEKFEELADPLEQDMTTFFDPTLAEQFDIMRTSGATQKREIYLMYPRIPLVTGESTRENGFIYLPEGLIAAQSNAIRLDNFMTQAVNVTGGTANPTLHEEREITSAMAPATSVTFTAVELSAANLSAGSIVGYLTTDIDKTEDVSLFFGLAGADVAEFYLDGKYLKSVGTPTAAAKVLNVTTSNLVGYDESIASLQYTETGFGFTITA